MNQRALRARVGHYTLVALLVVCALFPLYWMFNTSLLSTSNMFKAVPDAIPDFSRIGIYVEVFKTLPLAMWLGNSLVIAVGTTILSAALALFAAYALSRYRFRGRGFIGFVMFASQMLPEALLLVPLYAMFLAFGLLNQLHGLILVNTAFVMPILIWLFKGAIDSVPVEIEDAARIDGCSRLKLQVRIVWPLIAPAIVTGMVLSFFHAWNEYLLATTFLLDRDKRPASVGLASLIGELATPLDQVMAAATVYALPALIFFLIVQRHIVGGLTAGGVKG